ncbi:arginase family protein, partial [Arthrospira platensis SPKY2]
HMNPFVWQGRVDHEETGTSTRWHQHVLPFDPSSAGGMALIGFAVDTGVQRNGGRAGAAAGPTALRGALASLPVLGEPALWDAGDVSCAGEALEAGTLEAAQDALAGRIASVIGQGCLPLVLGGGHEV